MFVLLCVVGALKIPTATLTAYADDFTNVVFLQSFDDTTAPALPSDWTTSASGAESSWVTWTTTSDTAPNAAHVPDPAQIGTSDLVSPAIALPFGQTQLTFRNSYNLENETSQPTMGYDGGVLEISIGGGAFTDIVTAGGSFVSGGYNATLSPWYGNSLAGRQAWSGNSGGFVTTLVNLPAAAEGQSVQLRWRCGTDDSNGNGITNGWDVDSVSLVNFVSNSVPPNVIIDGSRTFQVIKGFGVNVNSGSWTNTDLQPVVDALIDQAGMTLFLVEFVGNCNWEATDANPGNSLTNWTYFDSVYSGPEFQQLWDMMAYLNQHGITNGAMPKFTGPTALWMGGDWVEPDYEDAYAKMLASALIYARQTQNLQFTVVPPLNEPDIAQSTGVYLPGGAAQYVTLVDDLGRQLDANGMSDVRFSGPNLATTDTNWMATMMNDSYLMSKLAHFGLHNYVGDTPGPNGVEEFIQQSAYPNTPFWMGEFNVWCHSCLSGISGDGSWTNAQAIASALINYLAAGASAALVYDAYDSVYNGYYLGTGQDIPGTWGFWGLFAVDDIYAANKTYTPRKQFYTLAQITRFVRPGAQRIDVGGASMPLAMLAFYNTNNGQFTLTGVNTNDYPVSLIGALTSLPALGSLELYYTDSTNNLLDSGSVPINNGAFTATVPPDCVFTLATIVPPSVTSLTDQALAQGADAFFSVSATGDAPLAYQWQFAGVAVDGATNSTFSRANIQCSDAGAYDVVVTNAGGSVTGSIAVLTVVSPPLLVASPTNQTVLLGRPASFSVAATNDCGGGLAYQWQLAGTNLVDATSASLLITNAQGSDTGAYTVIVSNLAGSVTSGVASLTLVLSLSIRTSVSPNNLVLLTLTGSAGSTYVLETTTDPGVPGSWQPIATNTLDADGLWYFSDLKANSPQRFYRSRVTQ